MILSWSQPDYLGGRTDTRYRVKCDACGGQVQFIPNTVRPTFYPTHSPFFLIAFVFQQESFNETRVKITGLNAVTTYRFQVFAENGVSHMSSKPAEYADIQVTTEAAVPSSITNVRVLSVKSTEIVLAWDAPSAYELDMENEVVDTYEVSWDFGFYINKSVYLQNLKFSVISGCIGKLSPKSNSNTKIALRSKNSNPI